MIAELAPILLPRLRTGSAMALVTICHVDGSAPRDAGTIMIVEAERIHGTIGGGALELRVIEQARRLIAAHDVSHLVQDYPLGPLLGQCCGGRVRIMIERIDAESAGWIEAVAARIAAGGSVILQTEFAGDAIAKSLVDHIPGGCSAPVDGAREARVAQGRPAAGTQFKQCLRSHNPAVLLFGAGHVGKAIARILTTLPYRLGWYDERPEMLDEDALGRAIGQLCADPVAQVSAAPPGARYLILTHSHALDYALVRSVLARGDFAYCGVIGSATKNARFRRRLTDDGIAPATIARLRCPIGLPTLKSKLPEVIAVSVAAELLALDDKIAAAESC